MVNVDYLIFGLMLLFGLLAAIAVHIGEESGRSNGWQTELTVIGVAATLGFCALFIAFSEFSYLKVWLAFCCTGGPVGVRRWLSRFHQGNLLRKLAVDNATPRA